MDNLILMFTCLLVGVGFQKIKAIAPNTHVALNQFAIYMLLPAITLYYIPKIHISAELIYPVCAAWFSFLLSWAFFAALGTALHWPKKLQGCLILTAGFLNSSFVGFPVIEALYGKKGLQTAILVDQPGSFVMLSTLGIIVAVLYSNGQLTAGMVARRVLLFPPFMAFTIGLLMNIAEYDFLVPLQSVLQKLGSCLTPVALVAVGLQLKIDTKSKHWGFLSLGLFVKLLLIPLVFLLVYKGLLHKEGDHIDISIMETAMPPMITAAIIASSHGLKPRLAGMMVGIGIPLSILTLVFWYFVLKHY
ncbi:AEC family transporter [Flavobacterium sp. RHBU_24]|uniref:AEC family transporter n=1 Tax=Flavobacterium sp. RHBU_24 TaxID=3391185 RepID=UPI003985288C